MKIAAYVHLRRTMGAVTGVGRHMARMVYGLSRLPGMDVTLLGSKKELDSSGKIDPSSLLHSLPIVPLPFSRGMLERIWWLTGRPRAERYVPDADWVYCAADAYVPTRRANFAVTLHDVEPCETTLPWSMLPENRRKRRMWGLRLAPMLKHSRLILTVSEFSKSRIVELLGVDPARIAVVYNGVDERFFQRGEGTLPPSDNPAAKYGRYVALVGGLSQRKGADYTFAVARELIKTGSDLRLIVSGKSDVDYARQAAEFPNIVELGFVPDSQLPAFLAGATSLLFLSRYEGFGMPIHEAMACGTPAVVANFSSLPEVAGEAGVVGDVNRPELICQSLLQLADDPVDRARRVALGLARARLFTWESCVNRLVTAFQNAS